MKYFLKSFLPLLFLIGVACSFSACSSDDDDDSSTGATNKKNKEAGEAFLLANRSADGVVQTYTGLQYKVDSLGTGVQPDLNDSVYITYVGQLYTGAVFTSTSSGLVVDEQILGMQEGVQLMKEGSVYDFYIPYYLAYKANSQTYYYGGNLVTIGSYSMLHFKVYLSKVVKIDAAD